MKHDKELTQKEVFHFLMFMETHGALDAYLKNHPENDSHAFSFVHGQSRNLIYYSFFWEKTPEGYMYWKRINHYWLEELQRSKK